MKINFPGSDEPRTDGNGFSGPDPRKDVFFFFFLVRSGENRVFDRAW